MKPVTIESRGRAFYCMFPLALYSAGERLQIVYLTGHRDDTADAVFEWPWKVQVGSHCTGSVDESEPVY